jgi:hypothetical protein
MFCGVACAPMSMPEAATLPLAEWESFYVIIGGSAAALTGLMFVVIAVVADAGPRAASPLGISAFVTPTIIHFCAALLISAILSAPWPGHRFVQLAMGLLGLGGISYSIAVWRRVRGVKTYAMVFEDWTWHVILPLLAYAITVAAALSVEQETVLALFLIGGASVLLLFIGIHNAWDTVTHLTLQRIQREQEKPGK